MNGSSFCHTQPSTWINNDDIIAIQWIYMICNSFISMLIAFFLSTLINYYQLKKFKSIIESLTEQSMNNSIKNTEVTKNKTIETLSNFMPFKPYQSFYINQATSPITLDELIIEAERTYKFTIYPYDDMLLDMHYLQIELVQQSSSIIITIEFFSGYNVLFPQIEELFSIVFHASKMIQIWGELNTYRTEYLFYHNHNEDDTIKSHIVNIQPAFKTWYNSTFVHNANCGQLLDFNDIDGPLCSCSHRPYKCRNDQWSLEDASAYTYHEILDNNKIHDPHRCLAITKLSIVIHEKWDRHKVQHCDDPSRDNLGCGELGHSDLSCDYPSRDNLGCGELSHFDLSCDDPSHDNPSRGDLGCDEPGRDGLGCDDPGRDDLGCGDLIIHQS
ncbi:unnamed protein product [Rotaria magnacalcarata]